MTDFVLVPGAWLGASAWDEVVPVLREAGYGVHPLSLSGLGEKQGVVAGQQRHVWDVVSEVERLGLRDVVLVGHSYSGIPVGQAAERIGGRLRRVVFVDSNIPTDGESFTSGWAEEQASIEATIADNDGFWPPLAAADFAADGMVGDQDLTESQVARLVAESTPHPGAALTEPAVLDKPLGELPATYVKCLHDGPEPNPDVAQLLASSERWHLVELNTGHWPMFSQPEELGRLLLDAAGPSAAAS